MSSNKETCGLTQDKTKMKNNIQTVIKIILCVAVIGRVTETMAQCTVSIPSGTWTGTSLNGVGNLYTSNANVTITDLGNNQFRISDFSGGFIGHFGHSDSNPIDVEIDCDNGVTPKSITTNYGNCQLISGSWNPSTNELILNWSLHQGRINESTKFNLNL